MGGGGLGMVVGLVALEWVVVGSGGGGGMGCGGVGG